MRVDLAYGDGVIEVSLPDDRTTVVRAVRTAADKNDREVVLAALRAPTMGLPLRERVSKGQTVAIAVCDGTRPQPRKIVVPAILETLDGLVRLEDVVILVATGTHRGNSADELEAMLGQELLRTVRVINHDARDSSSLTWVGKLGAGVPVWLNSTWLDADFRITTGFVEPHFFAGFSGGPKLVAPGLAGLETTLSLHDATRIGHVNARWGVTEGNPVHDDVRAITAATGPEFGLDVVLNHEKRVVAAFAGDVLGMHRQACLFAREISMRPVNGRFELVLTSNAGFPLDQNLYQAVKGMSAASEVVVPGGTIVCVAECRDGFPDHGSYRQQLTNADSPQALLDEIAARRHTEPDQWQIQIQAKIQMNARIIVHTSYLADDDLRAAHFEPSADPQRTIRDALEAAGPTARICVLPEGPLAVPYVVS